MILIEELIDNLNSKRAPKDQIQFTTQIEMEYAWNASRLNTLEECARIVDHTFLRKNILSKLGKLITNTKRGKLWN